MPDLVSGILVVKKDGSGMLRDPQSFWKTRDKLANVLRSDVRALRLVTGARIEGVVERDRKFGKAVRRIHRVCGLPPDQFARRRPFDQLVSIDPEERFHIGRSERMTMRVMDLFCPIGKGTRGLIVSPPKAGKTTILEDLANAILAEHASARVIALLVDERPEEVTTFRRSTEAEVWASNMDQSYSDHVALVNLALAHVRCELECGADVVVVCDSLTRMARAFTALVDTGSRMDNLIFEEFKGTGNSEIVLDRALSELRIFPAININASGTRREEKLYTEFELKMIRRLRRVLADQKPEEMMTRLLALMRRSETNEEFLADLPGADE